jgi:hypothetical protein
MSAVAPPGDREAKIRVILDDLLAQRNRMESAGAEPGLLEANQLAIAYWNWQLSRSGGDERAGRHAAA